VDVIGATRDNLILQDDLLLRESIICTELCVGNLGSCTVLILPGMEVIDLVQSSFIIQRRII
jgi:hypothetical protein